MSQKNNCTYLNYLNFNHAVPRQWTYTLQSNALRQELYTLIVAFIY